MEVGTSRRGETSVARTREPTLEAEAGADNGQKVPLDPVVQIDDGRIEAYLDEVVRATAEETLNALFHPSKQKSLSGDPGFWTPMPTVSAVPASTSAPRTAGIRGRAATTGIFRPRPETSL
jgi:hypothetical protein